DHMRLETERLEMKGHAGTAEPALHFVGNKKRARLCARLSDCGRECRRERPDTAFALDGLHDDGGGLRRHRGKQRSWIVDRYEFHFSKQRLERRSIVFVRG